MGINDTGFNDVAVVDSDLNQVTLFHQPTFANFPNAASFPTPAYMMDDSTGAIYKNNGSDWILISNNSTTQFVKDVYTLISPEMVNPSSASASSQNTSTYPASVTDDLSSDEGWLTNNTDRFVYDSTNHRINFDFRYDSSVLKYMSKLYGLLPDDNFVVKFKFVLSSISGTVSNYTRLFIGIASDYPNVNKDGIGLVIRINPDNSKQWGLVDVDNGDVTASNFDTTFTTAVTTGTYYIRIERLSTTSYKIGIYSDASYTNLIEEKTAAGLASTVQSLKYFCFHLSAVFAGSLVITGYVDDINISCNVTPSAAQLTNGGYVTVCKTNSEVSPSVTVSLGSANEIMGIFVRFLSDTNITKFKIETSADGTTFTRVKTVPFSLITVNQFMKILFPRSMSTVQHLKITGLDGTAKVIALSACRLLSLSENFVNRSHQHIVYDPNSDCKTLAGA